MNRNSGVVSVTQAGPTFIVGTSGFWPRVGTRALGSPIFLG
jgi:hypothetical protein